MQKPTSRFGQADANGIHRWEYGFLWWPDTRVLVTKYMRTASEENPDRLARYTCPMDVIQHADLGLCAISDHTLHFDDEEDFYRPSAWPRTFEVFKSRYDGSTGHKITLTRLDFRLMLTR
jgi:hypothetical protein